jgi:RNA polymerase sigma factor (sigma-70 family)
MIDEGVLLHPSVSTDQTPDVRTRAADAADDLYTRHAPLLRYIALRKFHVPPADADALVHDVFTTYFTRPDAVQSARPYLIGAICNAARYYWRARKNEEAALGKVDVAIGPLHEELLDSLSGRLLIASTLARLGSKCQDLLRRYYLEEETTAAIAAARNTTTDYILQLLHQCRKHARSIARSLTVL